MPVGNTKFRNDMKHINLMQPYVTDAMRASVQQTMLTRFVGQGPRVDEFERLFSERFAPPGYTAIATGSCTDALHLAYLLAGIKAGDDVIAPLFTCTATNIPLLWIGAKIRFCDVEAGGLNMSDDHARELCKQYPEAKTVVVNYGGKPCAVDADIDDCAQSLGFQRGQLGHADYECYSFQAVKHITTGDGGMLVLPEEQADKARRMRWFGIDRKAKLNGTWANNITEVGYKYQMTDIAAAMGIAGLETLDDQIKCRRLFRYLYERGLCVTDGIRVIDDDPDSACWLMTVLVDRREDLKRKLAERGIESDQVHYRNDRYAIFAEHVKGCRFPNMDAIQDKYLVLPLHMGMDAEDVDRICSVIREGW
jgi:dTDP-4-amino-4,6-dideoxygalactose transaminase